MTENEYLNEELRQQDLKEQKALENHQQQLMLHDYYCYDCDEYRDLPHDFEGFCIEKCTKCDSKNIETNLN